MSTHDYREHREYHVKYRKVPVRTPSARKLPCVCVRALARTRMGAHPRAPRLVFAVHPMCARDTPWQVNSTQMELYCPRHAKPT